MARRTELAKLLRLEQPALAGAIEKPSCPSLGKREPLVGNLIETLVLAVLAVFLDTLSRRYVWPE